MIERLFRDSSTVTKKPFDHLLHMFNFKLFLMVSLTCANFTPSTPKWRLHTRHRQELQLGKPNQPTARDIQLSAALAAIGHSDSEDSEE
jgi:hypothetical protein